MKKLITLILAVLLLFNTMAVFANEVPADAVEITDSESQIVIDEESYYEEEYTEPQETYEIKSETVKVDGKEYNARQLMVGYDYGDGEIFGNMYVEIAPLARELGYSVSYVEETDSVVLEKDGNKKEIFIQEGYVVRNDNEEDYGFIDVVSYEDRTYVEYGFADKVLDGLYQNYDGWSYDSEAEYSFHTAENLINEYKGTFDGYEKLLEILMNGTYTSKSNAEITFEFSIDDLGINIDGSCKMSENSLFDEGKMRIDLTMESDGILNFIDMVMQMLEKEDIKVDFDDKLEFSVIFDSEDLYLKGDLNKILIETEKPYFIDEEYELDPELEKLMDDASNGWLKMDLGELEYTYSLSIEDVVKEIACSTMSYDDKKCVLDIMSGVVKMVSSSMKETSSGYTCKINLNKSMLEALFALGNIEIPDEIKGISVDTFEATSEDIYNKNGSGSSESEMKIELSKLFPVNANTRIGELSITSKGEGVRKASKEKVTAPEKYTSYKMIEEKFDILYDEYYAD
ncbi:MAG: hypothetical protein J6A69_11965 [Clostridia bacterium]|nr:hypothetical protein [Clostridia bacterium]